MARRWGVSAETSARKSSILGNRLRQLECKTFRLLIIGGLLMVELQVEFKELLDGTWNTESELETSPKGIASRMHLLQDQASSEDCSSK